MSGSESSPLTSQVHQSIEQLIADTVRRSQAEQSAEQEQLRTALKQALTELEAGKTALDRAITALRSALGEPETEAAAIEMPIAAPVTEKPVPMPEPDAAPTISETAPERGAHELDIVAHGATIHRATGLQSFVRSLSAADAVQTREFVNGELRLHAQMNTGLDMKALSRWLQDNSGVVTTANDHVIEIRFAD